jgi:hypothetical protein
MKSLGYPLYVNGKLFDEPVTISHVPANAVGASDRDPSMGGLGRLSGLGQYVSYYPNFPSAMGADAAVVPAAEPEPSSGYATLAAITGPLFAAIGIYHGYKRNDSIGWALGWGLMTAALPIIMIPIALAQGFGKSKTMRANRSRRRRKSRAAARSRTPKRRRRRTNRRRR